MSTVEVLVDALIAALLVELLLRAFESYVNNRKDM